MNKAYQIFRDARIEVEYIIGYEGNAFASTGSIEEDILSITSVHPMRRDAVEELLHRHGTDWTVVENLLVAGKLLETFYEGKKFYMRVLRGGN